MKRIVVIVAVIAIAAIGWFALDRIRTGKNSQDKLQTEAASLGDLNVTVDADGVVRSNQSAQLSWQTSGMVDQVGVSLGDSVSTSQILASLDKTTLPQGVILAQADLVNAQRALEDLQSSRTRSAQAWQKVEDAQQALEDALNPAGIQADARQKLAEAQKAVEGAEDTYEIISKPPSQAAIDQAKANLAIAERIINATLKNIERINKKLRKDESAYMFFESREFYKRILEGLENKRVRDQRQYEDALNKYNSLLEPPDSLDVLIAEGNVTLKKAELQQAQTELERVANGLAPGEIAVLEAQLADAQREWERWKDGPDAGEITAAQARLAAAQATLNKERIYAPFDGVITGVYAKVGDIVDAGDQAFKLDDLSRLLVDARVSEIDINKIQVGQPVILRFDSIPDKQYSGKVVAVPVVGDTIQDVVSYKVVVEITDPDGNVRPGMTASAKIVTNSIQDVLLVPNRALRMSDGERVVYVLKDGKPLPVPLKLGIASDAYTQVLDGSLNAGDLILLDPPGSAGGFSGAQ